MAKTDIVYIRAIVDSTNAERNEYKPFNTTLTFGGKVILEVPVPAEEVRKEGDKLILTLLGWKAFLKMYTQMTTQLTQETY